MYRKLVRKALEMISDLADAAEDDDEDNEDSEDEDVEETYDDDMTEEEREKKREEAKKEKKEKYIKFWKEFGKNIKLGIIEDPTNRNKLAQLARFHSTWTKDEDFTSLDSYIERMKDNQDAIYFMSGESRENLKKAPALQKLIKGGYEVLLLDDPIDEFCM